MDPKLANGMAGEVRYDPTAHETNTRYRTIFSGSDKFKDIEVGFLQ
jgi:hypothetical protein